MKSVYKARFKKHYKQRIRPFRRLNVQFKERMALFATNPRHQLLHDHALTGDLVGFRSFSINGDIRVIYSYEGDEIAFYDVGTHNQVY